MRLPRCATSCAALALLLVGPAAHTAEPLSQGADLVWGATLGAVIVKPDGLKIDAKQSMDSRASGGVLMGARLARLPVSDGWPLYLELGYQDIAAHTVRYKVQGMLSDLTVSGHAIALAGRLSIPLTTYLGLTTRVGVAHTQVKGSTPAGQPAIAVSGSGTGLVHAAGLEYQFSSGPLLRGEIAGYSKTSSQSTAGAFALGMVFRF